MPIRNCRRLSLLVLLLCSWACAGAQGSSTFSKSADVNVWAGYLSTSTDRDTGYNKGVAAGANFAVYLNYPVYPALEARANISSGNIDNFKSYTGGLRLETLPLLRRYRVYGDFLAGFGTVHYVNCYGGNPGPVFAPGLGPGCGLRGDNAPVYSPGGGVEADLTPNFRLLADVQYELWNFGHDVTIHPLNATIGVSYRIPFRPHTRSSDYR